ncbi:MULTISPECIES: helix-turn-helix transcriptional regulator [Streptomyces]|uniref:helix-turn-helix transcriptional regulator n=1 Tax=Streptomyces TaxID=1883 RepID=UPI00345F240C
MRVQHLSQRRLAACAHVSQAFISLMLKGKRGACPETAWRIASALGVFTEELFALSPGDTASRGVEPKCGTALKSHTTTPQPGRKRTNRPRRAAPHTSVPRVSDPEIPQAGRVPRHVIPHPRGHVIPHGDDGWRRS